MRFRGRSVIVVIEAIPQIPRLSQAERTIEPEQFELQQALQPVAHQKLDAASQVAVMARTLARNIPAPA